MNTYPVDPEFCLIIHALRGTDSLRSAAKILGIEPAQLTRKIQKFGADQYFIQKLGNKWKLTEKGYRLAEWVDESKLRQQALLDKRQTLSIACYTWLGEEMLIPNLKNLASLTQNKFSWRINNNAVDLEADLLSGKVDYVITCHLPNDPQIAHKVFNPDPWHIVVPKAWEKKIKTLKSEDEIRKFLDKKPFIRLAALNPDQSLGFTPQMISDFVIDGVIGVRSAVVNELGWSCLPSLALTSVLKNSAVVRINILSVTKGTFSVWWMRSRKDNFSNVANLSKWLSDL